MRLNVNGLFGARVQADAHVKMISLPEAHQRPRLRVLDQRQLAGGRVYWVVLAKR
jgi:hypothetical protein